MFYSLPVVAFTLTASLPACFFFSVTRSPLLMLFLSILYSLLLFSMLYFTVTTTTTTTFYCFAMNP